MSTFYMQKIIECYCKTTKIKTAKKNTRAVSDECSQYLTYKYKSWEVHLQEEREPIKAFVKNTVHCFVYFELQDFLNKDSSLQVTCCLKCVRTSRNTNWHMSAYSKNISMTSWCETIQQQFAMCNKHNSDWCLQHNVTSAVPLAVLAHYMMYDYFWISSNQIRMRTNLINQDFFAFYNVFQFHAA